MTTDGARLAQRIRTRRHRARLAGLLPPVPTCTTCGHQRRSGGSLCATCWRRTPEGKAWNRERMRLARQLAASSASSRLDTSHQGTSRSGATGGAATSRSRS